MKPGYVTGSIRWVLCAEGLAAFVLSLILYQRLGLSWTTFAIFCLAPDLSLLGYLAGSRTGAVLYNAAHSYLGPAIAAAIALTSEHELATIVALIWTAHVGIDRALGFGLKYATSFKDTHLGRLGRPETA